MPNLLFLSKQHKSCIFKKVSCSCNILRSSDTKRKYGLCQIKSYYCELDTIILNHYYRLHHYYRFGTTRDCIDIAIQNVFFRILFAHFHFFLKIWNSKRKVLRHYSYFINNYYSKYHVSSLFSNTEIIFMKCQQ